MNLMKYKTNEMRNPTYANGTIRIDPFDNLLDWTSRAFEPWTTTLQTHTVSKYSVKDGVFTMDLPGLNEPPELSLDTSSGLLSISGKRGDTPIKKDIYLASNVNLHGTIESTYRNGVLTVTFADTPKEETIRKLIVNT